MIRGGEYSDIDSVCDMAESFWQHTIYNDPYDRQSVASMAQRCIDQGLMSILEINGKVCGFACGLLGALLANNSVPIGCEVAWWVDPDHRSGRNGIGLLKHLENSAQALGIKYWNMVYMQSSMPEQIKQIYERLGYRPNEVVYTRSL